MIGNPEDAWASLCPEAEKVRDECMQQKIPTMECGNQEEIADLTNDKIQHLPYTTDRGKFEREEVLPILRSLNSKQTEVFYFIRSWCLQKIHGNNPDPFHMFITGGAGTGKSHLIKAVTYEAARLLSKHCEQPDSQTILLTAFTGTAAFNIHGCTIHHAFKISKSLPFPYEPLKEQTLSPLRANLADLQILVIDEVSMIYKRLLYYIHERLIQIKRKKCPFGGVSVLAVGDFFQLPPVKQSKKERLYSDNGSYPIDHWNDLFSVVELNEIMRQRDDLQFAEMLNVLRTRTDKGDIPQSAMTILNECRREGPKDILHVFATNEEVNKHNMDMIKALETDFHEIPAKDYKKDKASGKLYLLPEALIRTDTDGLQSCLLIAEGARVMLTRNINVREGLANGVMGTVHKIVEKQEKTSQIDKNEVSSIIVCFDNSNIARHTKKVTGKGRVVTIERVEEDIRRTHTVRHQFPLKLAWACTAHKVQGMTVEKAVVDLNKVFSPGQAYVALSRVKTKAGLFLTMQDSSFINMKIYADKEIEEKIRKMKKFFTENEKPDDRVKSHETIRIVVFNIQRLLCNIENIKKDRRIRDVDAIFLTETWMGRDKEATIHLENFNFAHQTRFDSYTTHSIYTSKLKESCGGGVGIYSRLHSDFEVCKLPTRNLEGMMMTIKDQIIIIVLYRPQTYPSAEFLNQVANLLMLIRKHNKPLIIAGDFNENILKRPGAIQAFMNEKGFKQTVTSFTTESGTLIDHVYVSGNIDIETQIIPTYYSDHEAVMLTFKLPVCI